MYAHFIFLFGVYAFVLFALLCRFHSASVFFSFLSIKQFLYVAYVMAFGTFLYKRQSLNRFILINMDIYIYIYIYFN